MKNHTLTIIILFVILCNWACESGEKKVITNDGTEKLFQKDLKPFYHGVASGDPLKDRVIIWTRITPSRAGALNVKWRIAKTDTFEEIVKEGFTQTGPEEDYTIKVDVEGLEANTHYYYQFIYKGAKSIIGRTKTASGNGDPVQLAVVSCNNYEAGYYNAFVHLADREELDAIIHLGDYIYEYQPKGYWNSKVGRFHLPEKELISLADYRTRYAQYRLDEDFRKVHQQQPFIAIWDDHEISNNAFVSGAQNHQEEDGDYMQRREAARKAYYEWLPIRETTSKQLYRKIEMGKWVDVFMLDERLAGRTPPVKNQESPNYKDSDRSMLGEQQLQWLQQNLIASSAQWKIIGNQVIFSNLNRGIVYPKSPFSMDAWDGYPYEKARLKSIFEENQIANVVFITGDTHSSWAFEVPSDVETYKENPATLAVELATPSVTSSNYDESVSIDTVRQIEHLYQQLNPHLKFTNLSEHGYLLLKIDSSQIVGEWHYVETVLKKRKGEQLGKQVVVKSGEGKIQTQ